MMQYTHTPYFAHQLDLWGCAVGGRKSDSENPFSFTKFVERKSSKKVSEHLRYFYKPQSHSLAIQKPDICS